MPIEERAGQRDMARFPAWRLAVVSAIAVVAAGCGGTGEPHATPSSDTTAPSSPTSPAAASTVDRGEIGLAHGASAYYECRGEGGPPILFEAGTDIGGTEGSYDSLLGRLAEATAVCTCDRLGTGSSDPAPHRRRIMVDSCAVQDQVIAELRLTPPYVRAGQSGGGNLSIGFAARAGPVAAVVTIDSYHDDPQGLRAEGFDWRDNVEYVD